MTETMTAEHEAILNGLLSLARSRYDQGVPVVPVGVMCTDEENVMLNLAALLDKNRRDELAKDLRTMFEAANANAYAIMSEAWFARYDIDADLVDEPAPVDRDDRMQALTVLILDREGNKTHLVFPLTTDTDGLVTIGEPLSGHIAGTDPEFANLLSGPVTLH